MFSPGQYASVTSCPAGRADGCSAITSKATLQGQKGIGDDTTIVQAGIKEGLKVQMLGSTPQEIGGLKLRKTSNEEESPIARASNESSDEGIPLIGPLFEVCRC